MRIGAGRRAAVLAVHPGAELFGSDRMFLESVTGMVEGGLRVVVALPGDGPLVRSLQSVGADVVIVPMLVLRKSLLKPSGWAELVRLTFRNLGSSWRLLRRLRPTTLYISTVTLPLWPLVGKLRGARVVSHLHEAESMSHVLIRRVMHLPHLASDVVVVNSEFTRETLVQTLSPLAARSRVVYNGVAGPPSDPAPPRDALDSTFNVLYIGRLSPRKGVDVLVHAVARLIDAGVSARLVLLGTVFPGYEWFSEQLRTRVSELGMEQAITFAGFESDIWSRLAEADVLVVPSVLDESFGNTLVEGMLGERPVIASDIAGLREAAGDAPSVVFAQPGDAESLTTQLEHVYEDWGHLRHGTARSRELAETRNGPAAYRAAIATVVSRSGKAIGIRS